MNKEYVLACFGCQQGFSLETLGQAHDRTEHFQYDADAKKVLRFLNQLPCGVLDRVVKKLQDDGYPFSR